MGNMFYDCISFNNGGIIILNFDTTLVTAMYQMFYNCSACYCDLSSWNVTNHNNFNTNSHVIPPNF